VCFLEFGLFLGVFVCSSLHAFRVMSSYGARFGGVGSSFGRSGRYRYKSRVPSRAARAGRFRRARNKYYRGPVSKYRGAMYGSAAARAMRFTNANATGDELKYLDVNFANYACGTTGAVTLINGIAAGNTSITREGRQCFWKQIIINGTIVAADATTIASRNDVYVVWDKQPGAAVPAMTDLFVESKAGSPMNLNYRERFVVLAHNTYVIGGLTADSTALTPTIQPVTITKRINLRTTFKGDANAIGDISTGAMYLVTVGDQADASGALLKTSIRLRFSERAY